MESHRDCEYYCRCVSIIACNQSVLPCYLQSLWVALRNLSSVLLCLLYMISITPVLSRIMITINHDNVYRTDGYHRGLDDSGVVFNYDL
jgi:hypothetical protein